MKKDKWPICPSCGAKAHRRNTEFGVQYYHCHLWGWGGHPLVTRETHTARRKAHAEFDPLWKSGMMSRKAAYRSLASELRIHPDQCHMKLMDRVTAEKVPDAVHYIRGCEEDDKKARAR